MMSFFRTRMTTLFVDSSMKTDAAVKNFSSIESLAVSWNFFESQTVE